MGEVPSVQETGEDEGKTKTAEGDGQEDGVKKGRTRTGEGKEREEGYARDGRWEGARSWSE